MDSIRKGCKTGRTLLPVAPPIPVFTEETAKSFIYGARRGRTKRNKQTPTYNRRFRMDAKMRNGSKKTKKRKFVIPTAQPEEEGRSHDRGELVESPPSIIADWLC